MKVAIPASRILPDHLDRQIRGYTAMITIEVKNRNPISQKNYDKIVSSLPLRQLRCTCGRGACLIGHGFYNRSIHTQQGKLLLTVKRLRCKECGRTHAILLSGGAAYCRISTCDHFQIVRCYESKFSFSSFPHGRLYLDENNGKSIILKYRRYFRQRLLSENLLNADLPPLIRGCFRAFC